MPRTARLPRLARLRWQPPVLLLVAVVVAGAGVALAATMTPGPPAVTAENVTIDVPEGPGGTGRVRLDTTVYRPAATPAPAVLVAHGFGGSKNSVSAEATALARRGFVVLAWTARGFGASTGAIGLDSPRTTRWPTPGRWWTGWPSSPMWSTTGPAIRGSVSPGASYGGALALLLAGTDRRVDARGSGVDHLERPGSGTVPERREPSVHPRGHLDVRCLRPGRGVQAGLGGLLLRRCRCG